MAGYSSLEILAIQHAYEAMLDDINPFVNAPEHLALIDKAYRFCLEKYDGRYLVSGKAYMFHLIEMGRIAVLEVGMGGEWDATNVIPAPEAAVICAIGLDHTGTLGNTPAEIAGVKAGIIKPGCAVASYGSGEEAEAVIEARCAEKGCPLVRPDLSQLGNLRPGLEGCRFDYGAYQDLFVPLAGTYQPRNAALAVTASELLRSLQISSAGSSHPTSPILQELSFSASPCC